MAQAQADDQPWIAYAKRLFSRTLAPALVAVLSVGMGPAVVNAQVASEPSPSLGDGPATVRVVGLGDSIMTTNGCASCALYLDQYAAGLSDLLGADVTTNNLATPGAVVADVLAQVRDYSLIRSVVAEADVVVITVGLNDLSFARGDDPCGVEAAWPVVDWEGVTESCTDGVAAEYGRDLDALLSEIDGLRDGAPTLVLVTTVYNAVVGNSVDPGWDAPEAVEPSVYAVEGFYQAACDAATAHDAVCVDTYHTLNGSAGRDPAGPFLAPDYTHLGQAGHDAFAEVLLASRTASSR